MSFVAAGRSAPALLPRPDALAYNPAMFRLVLGIYALMSAIAFLAFAIDKRAAGRGDRRTPERVLHTLELLCGWPGALAAVWLLRHKSAKTRFRLIQWGIIALHIAAWTAVLILRRPPS